jgi:electron transfer flavoprotein alpha subunit
MVDSLYGIKAESKSIWVFMERDGNSLEGVSLELLSKSREIADQLGWQVVGLLMGDDVQNLGPEVIAYGADQVWVADHPLLSHFTIEAYGQVTFQAIMDGKPSVFLCGATPNGRDLAGRLAVRLRTGLNADCTNLYMNIDTVVLVSEVSGFGGGVLALIEMADHRPQMATVRPGVFPPAESDLKREGEVVILPVQLTEDMIHTQAAERVTGESIDLTQAENLVVGGRGITGDFKMMTELAGLIGGDFGATRPPVDEGHIERDRMVGQTGVICRPKVAICCGISGAFHFVVGIREAETVIAINTDPEAPIFDHADYCVVGDVHEIVPKLIQALKTANPGLQTTGDERSTVFNPEVTHG